VKDWHWQTWQRISHTNIDESRTRIGRRRLIPKGTDDWHIFTSEVNVPIQGGCADALKLNIIELYDVLPEGSFLVAALHDELIIETEAHRAPDILSLAKGIMEEWASEMFSGVPMVVKGVICKSWS
jgi:DNA polymerase I-like protein with 3'-5' exonuclease and polymerase domains